MNFNILIIYLTILIIIGGIYSFFKGIHGLDDNTENNNITAIFAIINTIIIICLLIYGLMR